MFDLDAYLERVGLSGRPGFAEIHRAHVTSVPFENLDPHRGIPVSLDPGDLEHKMVTERRGGYCFEQNLLLKEALEALGAEVELMLARVRMGTEPGTIRPRTHLLLRVGYEGARWHADVGLGGGAPLEPLPFGPGGEHEQSGWRFRVVEQGEELVLQGAGYEDWADLYAFLPQPVPKVDVETSNWFTSTNPGSPFVTGLLLSTQGDNGTRTTLSDWSELVLIEESPAGSSRTAVERAEIPGLIETRFGMPGFALDGEGRVVSAAGATPRG